MNWFLLIALAVLAVLGTFLGYSLTGIGSYSWLIAAIMTSTILLYPLVWYDVLPYAWDQIVRAIVHVDIGLLSILMAFIVIRDIVFIPVMFMKPGLAGVAFSKPATLLMFAVAFVILCFGYWKARRGPKIIKVQVPIEGLPDVLDGYTILQISDLHAGGGINRKYVENVVRKALSLQVDIIVLTGDIADGNFVKYKNRVEPIAQLIKQVPVLYISGNHEYIRDSDKWLHYFSEMGIRVLLNEHTIVLKQEKSILFAGVIDPEAKEVNPTERPDIQKSIYGSPVADVRILLAHQPNIAKEASKHFDLQLSGHTHAGQFFPWNLVIKIFQPFAAGLKKCGSMWVYTSAGTGFWGPPFRIGTTSEITVHELVKTTTC